MTPPSPSSTVRRLLARQEERAHGPAGLAEAVRGQGVDGGEAIRLIRPGRRILIGSGAAEPVALVQALVEKGEHLGLGLSVDVVRSAVEAASLLIAEVNPRMPRTHGASFVHVSRLHRLVPVDQPLLERPHEEQDEVSQQIGSHIARLIPDGATLQLGIGRIPDAVLAQLSHHGDLGLHTEMMSDGVMHLHPRGLTAQAHALLPPLMAPEAW